MLDSMAVSVQPSVIFREGLQLLSQVARTARTPTGALELSSFQMALCSKVHNNTANTLSSRSVNSGRHCLQRLSARPSLQAALMPGITIQPSHSQSNWLHSYLLNHTPSLSASQRSSFSATKNSKSTCCAFHSTSVQQARKKQPQSRGPDAGIGLKRTKRGHAVRNAVAGDASTLDVNIETNVLVEEQIDIDDELDAIMEDLETSTPRLVKEALSSIDPSELEGYENVWLSVLLCTDDHIRGANKKWRNEDKATDVLSFPQEWIEGIPELLLGDVVISLDTARVQAQERSHSLLDELRILLVHGLLHLLDYDHEASEEEADAQAGEEERLLGLMGWSGKGLIEAMTAEPSTPEPRDRPAETSKPSIAPQRAHGLRPGKAREYSDIKVLFLDMDGTLLDGNTRLSKKTADACRAALAKGVKLCIATGKARPAAIDACSVQNLSGPGGVVSTASPGVFLQGLRVYGDGGELVHSQELESDIVREAFAFSLENRLALAGFSGDRVLTLFEHPLIDKLHTTYYEPKAEILPSIDALLAAAPINKLLFYDTPATIHPTRALWEEKVRGIAAITQAVPEMLEVLPFGASKGAGVRRLMAHLKVSRDQVMAVGDGENDLEMLQIAGLGVAMANGAPVTLEAAHAHVGSNDEDGVAEAIERFILSS